MHTEVIELIDRPMGLLLAAMLVLLTVVALATLVVLFMSLVAAVLTPLMAAIVAAIRRWRWRNWHPSTDWLADEGVSVAAEPVRSPAVALVSSHAQDADVRLVTAQVPSTDNGADATLTAVHARLAPAATLELPPHARCTMVVCVLAGHGTVGADHRPVAAGELAVVAPGAPVSVAAGPGDGVDSAGPPEQRPAMEVLVAQGSASVAREQPRRAPVRRGGWLQPVGAAVARLMRARPSSAPATPRRRPAA